MKQDISTGNTKSFKMCYYYLHIDGSLIYKDETYSEEAFEESNFVKHWWKVDLENRMDAYNFLIHASLFGANQDQIDHLKTTFNINNVDTAAFCEKVGIIYGTSKDTFFCCTAEHMNGTDEAGYFESVNLFDAVVEYYRKATLKK